MGYYITYGEIQKQMKEYFLRTGNKMQFHEIVQYAFKKGLCQEMVFPLKVPANIGQMTDENFDQFIDTIPLDITMLLHTPNKSLVAETDIIPEKRDVYAFRHPRYTREQHHKHNYFEIDYVVKGNAFLYFENSKREMHEGELCIIAPGSDHDYILTNESSVYTICIRQSTFETTFFQLISRQDLLSSFFRNILRKDTDQGQPNYLLFFSKENEKLKHCIQNIIIESHIMDPYSNASCINYTNLMFSNLLRSYSQTLLFYNFEMGSDFSLILQYIQHNYKTVTLASLADFFHYSQPHLCTLIKKHTNHTFSSLIKDLRLSNAVKYLTETDLKIGEIADAVGYNSADHFSRIFRNSYHMSPSDYRKLYLSDEPEFIPFSQS
ncbi:MAG: AraC family transcriptional regulator [Lachnospiraceae bacterium]|nr:AraC family transcriptional regulator [Lachnospiraceae bacterium]